MKTAKRVLAILMAMLMAVSVFAVAASAAGSLQTAIDNAAAGATVKINSNTKESVTINKNLTLDLGGKILKSVEGSPAITVSNGAQVTITNGYVESFYYSYSGATQKTLDILKDITTAKNPSAIVAKGAGTKVTLTDVRAMGGLVRIPKTREWFVPTGSALKIYGGATAELNNAVLIGSYAVSNDPDNTGSPAGTVVVNDAILIGFMDYVKRASGLVYDEATVEKVNAADRIAGFLNDGIKLEKKEINLLKKVMDDRVYIFTTKPTDDKAVVTINMDAQTAVITAEVVEDLVNTDCSYKYVPENAYDVATGKTFALDTEIPAAEVLDKDIRINYRLEFQLKGDIKKFANNFGAKFDEYYAKAIQKADAAFTQVLDTYDSKLQQLADIFDKVDEAGGTSITVGGTTYNAANELGDDFWAIERAILSVGGVTLYNKTEAGEDGFTTMKFKSPLYNNGAAAPAEGTYVKGAAHSDFDIVDGQIVPITYYDVEQLGTLDKLNALIEEFKAIKAGASLGDQSKWVDYVQFVVDNYEGVLDIIAEAETNLKALQTTLKTGKVGEVVDALGMKSELKTLDNIVNAVVDVNDAIDTALDNSIVADVRAKVNAHANDGTVEEYVGKVKAFVNDYTTYFTPEDFLLEGGAFGKTYRVTGPTRVEIIAKGKLNVKVLGDGSVAYTPDNAVAGSTASEQFVGIGYDKAVTLTATAKNGAEFMYYVNTDTQRILSTDPVLEINTQIERYVEAVFESASNAQVVFTNGSGVISDVKAYTGSIDTASVEKPYTAGYNVTGWGPNGNTTLTSADFVSAYQNGSSAFVNGAVYNSKGYAFKLNASTANKYLATPKYEAKSQLKIYFYDEANADEKFGSDAVPFGKTITYTAQGENFLYWAEKDTGVVRSLYATYEVQALKDLDLVAVYGNDTVADAYVNIAHAVEEADRVVVYGERSVAASRKILTVGMVVSFVDAIPEPTVELVDRTNVLMAVSTRKDAQGIVNVGITNATMNKAGHDGVCYVRAFVELETATGSEYVYSDTYVYP